MQPSLVSSKTEEQDESPDEDVASDGLEDDETEKSLDDIINTYSG